MIFRLSLIDCKSPQVSRTRLGILAVFRNAVVWLSTSLPTSRSSRPFNNLLVTVPKAPITIGISVTFMFHSFFQFRSKVEVLIILSEGTAKSTILFCLGLVFWPRLGYLSVCQSPKRVYVCHFFFFHGCCYFYNHHYYRTPHHHQRNEH